MTPGRTLADTRSWKESSARISFYRALFEQAQRARYGQALMPITPPDDELTYVDGFLVWEGRPVWWSGETANPALTKGLEGPGIINPEVISRPPEPEPRRRGIGRFLHALGLI